VKPFHAEELQARILVGLRVMTLQETLADRVKALEAAALEIKSLKLHIPFSVRDIAGPWYLRVPHD